MSSIKWIQAQSIDFEFAVEIFLCKASAFCVCNCLFSERNREKKEKICLVCVFICVLFHFSIACSEYLRNNFWNISLVKRLIHRSAIQWVSFNSLQTCIRRVLFLSHSIDISWSSIDIFISTEQSVDCHSPIFEDFRVRIWQFTCFQTRNCLYQTLPFSIHHHHHQKKKENKIAEINTKQYIRAFEVFWQGFHLYMALFSSSISVCRCQCRCLSIFDLACSKLCFCLSNPVPKHRTISDEVNRLHIWLFA